MHYIKDEAEQEIPVWRMIAAPLESLRKRAERWAEILKGSILLEGASTVGGGSLPEEILPTWLLGIQARSPNRLLDQLRAGQPAVIARLENEMVVFDPRTVMPEQDQAFIEQVRKIIY
jgi:L-seryl-tRNA(Ser) seleniumtransferase